MLFNSLDFAIFFPLVFIGYWFVFNKKLSMQNAFLLVVSYFFYACWDWRFLFLLMFSTLLDYYSGLRINEAGNDNKRKVWLWLSIGINLGFLGFFKYYNFFINSFTESMSFFGYTFSSWTLNIILPVGISFYTFHGLSYVIDIYKRRIEPVHNFVDYSVFVSFFPLLVAGPIERATHLLPQIQKERKFDYSLAVNGMKQILWGLFKKIVIADSCAKFADMAFNNTGEYSGSTLFLGAIFFAFQIYGDFSGYSDIALGTAKLLGIKLLRNFSYPFFSRDIAEFWRRWHISLSSWFRDYVYIPLGGSRVSRLLQVRNVAIVFLLSGFWHGANWTFIVWGALHAVYFIPLLVLGKNRQNLDGFNNASKFPSIKEVVNMGITFGLVTLAWVFFRADSVSHALTYLSGIFSLSLFSFPEFHAKKEVILVLLFLFVEWLGRHDEFAAENIGIKLPAVFRISLYYIIAGAIIYYAGEANQFIYFQF